MISFLRRRISLRRLRKLREKAVQDLFRYGWAPDTIATVFEIDRPRVEALCKKVQENLP